MNKNLYHFSNIVEYSHIAVLREMTKNIPKTHF